MRTGSEIGVRKGGHTLETSVVRQHLESCRSAQTTATLLLLSTTLALMGEPY